MTVNPKLVVLSEQLRGHIFELDNERYQIGRSPDMDIYINDQTVSGYHCYLERNQNECVGYDVIDNNQSTNGTRINGEKVSRKPLVNGDILQVGNVECLYESDSDMLPDSSTTNTEIELEDDVWEINDKTKNLKPQKWQNDDRKLSTAIKSTLWGLLVVVTGLIAWLIVTLVNAPPAG